jgi:hypothetical protein
VVGAIEGVRRVDVVVAGAASGVAEVFVDAGGHVAEAYGGQGEYLLVRPDGYAGWIGMVDLEDDLKLYLEQVMG